jgi:hypothetical protein
MNLPSALRKIFAGDEFSIDFFVPPENQVGYPIALIFHRSTISFSTDLWRISPVLYAEDIVDTLDDQDRAELGLEGCHDLGSVRGYFRDGAMPI